MQVFGDRTWRLLSLLQRMRVNKNVWASRNAEIEMFPSKGENWLKQKKQGPPELLPVNYKEVLNSLNY